MVGGGGNRGFAFLPSLQLLQRFSTLGRHKAPFTSDVQYVVLPSHIVPATRDNYQKCVNDHDIGVKSESIRIRTYLYTPAGTPPKIHKYGENCPPKSAIGIPLRYQPPQSVLKMWGLVH